MSSSSGQGDLGNAGNAGDMGDTGIGQQGTTGQAPSGAMGTGTQVTDSSQNLQYDLISTLYHACKSNTAIQQYISDANTAGNGEAAQFFQMVAQQDQQRAQRAQELLNQLTSSGGTTH